ncbi:MAG: carbamoyltransferase HypF [Desulfovibrio sp.]|jgi:hydrogenase maturation protein HypF|nr:carbamoyltransferase HypF [Desulfovibrio sp.]
MSVSLRRRVYVIQGQVQGVGFRPFVWRIATGLGLTGTVGNTSQGVRIEAQGTQDALDAFERRLQGDLPPLARIARTVRDDADPVPGETSFDILRSAGKGSHTVLVSPDVGTCPKCFAEMRDPGNRRHGHPFINCTDCGPRYTITRSIPYDRAVTTMACFPMCPACAAEYADPGDRRFHAQPIACPSCGPRLWYVETGGADGSVDAMRATPEEVLEQTALSRTPPTVQDDPIGLAARALRQGKIVAVKGLGGFHLACDARSPGSVATLRHRKRRPHKPLAVMVRNAEGIADIVDLDPLRRSLMEGPERPIVLCPRNRKASTRQLPDLIAPDSRDIGVMLPSTPLHMALLERMATMRGMPPILVMTSGNPRGEPLCLGNREAIERLGGIADALLLHDRDILVRVDDSVVAVREDPEPGERAPVPLRRARGYVPRPVRLSGSGPTILGTGGELRNTLCLVRGREAFVSQHIGDMENPATSGFFEETAAHLERLLEVRPQGVVCDLHPDFQATRHARARAVRDGLPLWHLQHHAAHAASLLAEHRHDGPAIVVALDGTGLGDDGTIWGGEVLRMDLQEAAWERVGGLTTFPLPGGDVATRNPWRIALALERLLKREKFPRWERANAPDARLVAEMLEKGINCPMTSSCGRLFDAVSARLGLCEATTYEGQAAVRLETLALQAHHWRNRAFKVCGPTLYLPADGHEGMMLIDAPSAYASVLKDLAFGYPMPEVAARFHANIAKGFADIAIGLAHRYGIEDVGLTGGAMQNALLAWYIARRVAKAGLRPMLHRQVPAGDGGISLGQAVWGRRMLALGRKGDSW